jgi:hypothetical protein
MMTTSKTTTQKTSRTDAKPVTGTRDRQAGRARPIQAAFPTDDDPAPSPTSRGIIPRLYVVDAVADSGNEGEASLTPSSRHESFGTQLGPEQLLQLRAFFVLLDRYDRQSTVDMQRAA